MSAADLSMFGQMSRAVNTPPPAPVRGSGGSVAKDRFHARLLKAFEKWTTPDAVQTIEAAEILGDWNKRSVLHALARLEELGLVQKCSSVTSSKTKNRTLTWKRVSIDKEEL